MHILKYNRLSILALAILLLQIPYPMVATANPSSMVAVYRFYNLSSKTHFYTASDSEASRLKATMSSKYRYEKVAFHAYSTNVSGTTAAYRFYNFKNGTHFYTTSLSEKQRVQQNYSNTYRYEKIAYYTNTLTSGSGNTAVYRFYKPSDGTHFYTASSSEASRVRNTMSGTYRYEKIAYGAVASKYYANCTEVRDSGNAPLYKGEPGYEAPRLDRDEDGIACEIE